jgi:HEAT repeat protein
MSRKGADSHAQGALDALNALDPVAPRTAQLAVLLNALNDKHVKVVARAATLAGERLLHELSGDLVYAYARLLKDPVKRDPGCKAKQAIARALVTLECQDLEFYRAGIVYRQLEPAWGRPTDTATDVRCSCAMGLAAAAHPRAVAELTGLLTDPEAVARSGAARAISCGNPQEAEAVLRFKVHIGDAEPEVIGECFSALLIIEPEHSLPFVAGYLRHEDDALRELAALALGESRLPEGLKLLRDAWDDAVASEARGALIRAAALHRSEPAFEWLLDIIATGSSRHAQAAVEALAVYERNARLIEQIEAAKARRTTPL